MRISDLSSYVCSSDLFVDAGEARQLHAVEIVLEDDIDGARDRIRAIYGCAADRDGFDPIHQAGRNQVEIHLRTRRSERLRRCERTRSEEHTSELQSLMRISYAVFCLKKKKSKHTKTED